MYYQVAFFYYIGISILLKMIWCLRDKWEMFMVHIPEHTRSLSGSLFGHKTMP